MSVVNVYFHDLIFCSLSQYKIIKPSKSTLDLNVIQFKLIWGAFLHAFPDGAGGAVCLYPDQHPLQSAAEARPATLQPAR